MQQTLPCVIVKRSIILRNLVTINRIRKKAWRTINDVLGRNRKHSTVNEIKLPGKTVTSTDELVEVFKVYMTRNFLSPSWKDLLKQYNNFFFSFSFSFFQLEIF